jgi:hypothetical protein
MEKVYPRLRQTDIAAIHLRQVGESRIVYFPCIEQLSTNDPIIQRQPSH